MERRNLLRGAAASTAAVAATAGLSAPAISQNIIELRLVHSWPKGLPGAGTGVDRLAANIQEMSGGRVRIRVFAAGELVPALRCMDAVMDGTADMGHDASFYHHGKSAAFSVFFAVPFGMTAQEQMAWMSFGGGWQLWDELNAQFGIIAFPAGQTAAQSFGWFKREINSMADFRGLKMRIPGLGGDLINRVGGSAVLLPGGEIFAALQSGAIDAGEFIGPLNDLALGFHQVAKISYGPGVQEPGGMMQLMVNRRRWDSLPSDVKAIIRIAAREQHEDMKVEYDFGSGRTMEVLRTQHGVRFLRLNNDVLTGLGNAAGEMVNEMLNSNDAYMRRVMQSYLRSRENTMRFLRFNEQAFLNARTLNIRWPTVTA
ncbi:MAG TPA: TRAP transporter substrate-binding protein [Acetobacteraceae bacterium]|jgi:TRAP-type mannitol/chloroaromatic compound transport system substrate-binding protein|nr:TRAP transporter substrate-binding protein [Acetobacteraceae bacterium]